MTRSKAIMVLCGIMFCLSLAAPVVASEWESMPLATKAPANTQALYLPEDGLGTKGEGFQYVFALTYAPSDPSRAYFSVDTTGVWRSDDGGHNWYPVFNGMTSQGACSVAVDPSDPDIVLAAGMLGYERKRSEPHKNRQQGIFRTTDGGRNWTKVRDTGFYRRLGKGTLFAFVPPAEGKEPSVVFAAGSDEGLLRSEDRGVTWNKVRLDREIGEIHDMKLQPGSPVNNPTLLLITEKGLYRVTGTKADKIGKGLPEVSFLIMEELEVHGLFTLAVTPADPSLILVAAGKNGIWRSTDGGVSFKTTSFNVVDWLKKNLLGATISDVAISPVDSRIAYARCHLSSVRPLYSTDGGISWQTAKDTNLGKLIPEEGYYFSSPFAPHPTQPQTALHVSNGRARILRTEDGGQNWIYSGRGFTGACFADVAFLSASEFYVSMIDHSLWHTVNGGRSFEEIHLERLHGAKTGGPITVVRKEGQTTILMSLGNWSTKGIALSKDGGESWTYNDKIRTERGVAFVHPANDNLMFISRGISRDGGKSWQTLGNQITGQLCLYAVGEGPDFKLYAMSDKDKTQLYISEDLGKSWMQTGNILPFRMPNIKDMALTNNRLLAATSNGIYQLDLDMKLPKWEFMPGLPEDRLGGRPITGLAVNPKNHNEIWATYFTAGYGKGPGMAHSADGGKTWRFEDNSKAPLFTLINVVINPFDNTIYVASSFGTYRKKLD